MKHFLDVKRKGHVFKFDGPLDVIQTARKSKGPRPPWGVTQSHMGKKLSNWDEAEAALREPWKEGLKMVQQMYEEIRAVRLPAAISRKRRGAWHDADGDVDPDRFLKGDPEMFRRIVKPRVKGPGNVTILANVDGSGYGKGLVWRGAMAAALADILEEDGYVTEVWSWTAGNRVYQSPNHKHFHTYAIKKAGEPVDTNTIITALSGWMLRIGIFGSFGIIPEWAGTIGGADFRLALWKPHMDVNAEESIEIRLPEVFNKADAIRHTIGMLDRVVKFQNGEVPSDQYSGYETHNFYELAD